jgi:hypothetical protein
MALPAVMPSSFSNLHHHTGHYFPPDRFVLFGHLNSLCQPGLLQTTAR